MIFFFLKNLIMNLEFTRVLVFKWFELKFELFFKNIFGICVFHKFKLKKIKMVIVQTYLLQTYLLNGIIYAI